MPIAVIGFVPAETLTFLQPIVYHPRTYVIAFAEAPFEENGQIDRKVCRFITETSD